MTIHSVRGRHNEGGKADARLRRFTVDPTQLGGQLFALTGSLQTAGQSTAADLQTARVALATTIQAGAATDTKPAPIAQAVQQSSGIRFAQLDAATQSQFTGVQAGPAPGFVSNSPVVSDLNPSTPAWARGMAVSLLGPFEDTASGSLSWVGIIHPLPQKVNVKYGSQVVAVATILGVPAAGKASYELIQGSIWIDAQLLASGSPASSWTGFRVKSGTLSVGAHTVAGGDIVLDPGAHFAVHADLDPQPAPNPVTGPGADASLVTVDLPGSIIIEAQQSGAVLTPHGTLGAKIYGSSLALKRNANPLVYNVLLSAISVPCDVGPKNFSFKSVKSTLFKPSGAGPVLAAGWLLPVAVTTPDQLGQASGTGEVGLFIGSGTSIQWAGTTGKVDLLDISVIASPGGLGVIAQLATGPETDTWQLWNGKLRPSTLEFSVPAGGIVTYISTSVAEELIAGGSVVAHTDRPVEATGLRVAVSMPVAVMFLVQTKALPSGILLIEGAAPLPKGAQASAFALANAFIEALPPQLLIAGGRLQGTTVSNGVLLLYFGMNAFVPTLPDPYATDAVFIGDPPVRDTQLQGVTPTPIGVLLSAVIWISPSKPVLTFELLFAQASGTSNPLGNQTVGSTLAREGNPGVNLLDVSSRADQFGVNWAPQRVSNILSDHLYLTSEGVWTSLFTVSAISWEPMIANDPVPVPPIPPPPSDGVPSKLTVPTVRLAPIAPIPLMVLQHESAAAGHPITFTGTLPFGMIAEVQNDKGAQYDFVRPAFDGYLGGHQISLIPPNPTSTKPEFAGQTILTPYGEDVLGTDVATIFEADFTSGAEPGVPVRRYDLSGYGASLFSEWDDPDVNGTGILKVQFTVWVGRTAFEVVKAQSIIYPWGIKIVRTITIQRMSGGAVIRKDSGWQAATPGTFVFPPHDLKGNPNEFNGSVHAGPVQGVFNVRNIRDNGAQFPLDGNTYVPVLFDADVKINPGNPVVNGAFQNVFVPGQSITGYAQLAPDDSPATRAALADLLQTRGAASGPIACTINIGKAGQQMKVGLVEVSAVGFGETAVFVAALRGTPVLPRDGQWSMGVRTGSAAPLALGPQTAVPLIQPNGDTVWHLADPADILNLATPSTQYGYLQGTSTQKSFFGSPQIPQGANKVSIPDPPHIADVGSLLGATGIFPDLAKALNFPSPQDLALGALGDDTLTLNNLASFPVTQPPLTLVDFGPVSVVLVYEDRSQAGNPPTQVTFKLDPNATPRWSIDFAKFTFVLVTPFGDVNDPLLQVVGAAHADADSSPTLKDLKVVYGSILSLVQQIFSKLDELASFLPGNKSYLDVSLSNGQLTIQDKFALPTLPLGLGEITNVALVLGATMTISPLSMSFTAGIASPDEPFQWLVSPLSGTGCVQVGFQDSDATLLIQAGIGVGLSIDVGIAEGSASIVLAFQVDNTVKPFELKVILTGQASVDVLGGLASASLMLSAALAIVPALPEITFIGSVAVGIHISICWVINIDFDGSWQFSQSVTA